MAVPTAADRCPSCRARARDQLVLTSSVHTGPDAADAWAEVHDRPPDPSTEPAPERAGDVRAARPVGPGAAAAHTGLRLVELAALVVAAVGLARATLALVVDDGRELHDLGWWDALSALAVGGLLLAGATLVAAAVLLARWAAAAGRNVRALALDVRRWVRGGEQVLGRLLVFLGLVLAWWVAPAGPERSDRAIDLGLGVLAAVALVMVAGAAQRLLVSITTVELHRAETLARIESATTARPRGRA
jgi:hypothetical protein